MATKSAQRLSASEIQHAVAEKTLLVTLSAQRLSASEIQHLYSTLVAF